VPTREDIPHYTPAEVDLIINRALIVVDELNVPDDLRAVAFTQAATLLAAKTVQIMQPQQVPFDLRNLRGQAS
jgi:hypothetical protein